jgi:hypothetical protein
MPEGEPICADETKEEGGHPKQSREGKADDRARNREEMMPE